MDEIALTTPPGASAAFEVRLSPGQPGALRVSEAGGMERAYPLGDRDHPAWLNLFEALAGDFGLRRPLARAAPPAAGPEPRLRPILTEPVSPRILYGYGDPCVARVGASDYRLLVTSNDAPDAFPILRSRDLTTWRLAGFVFPEGSTPAWALSGRGVSDFWAPELHRVGDQWWVCFTARRHDRTLAIGLARAASPDGPFVPGQAPIVAGGAIDSHILVDAERRPWLVWKADDNAVWPRRLNAFLHARPRCVRSLFVSDEDRRTASFLLTLQPWIDQLEPMEQFFVLQPLIEAAAHDLAEFELRLTFARAGADEADRRRIDEMLETLRTRIYAQRLSADGRRLEGAPAVILENDQPWEGHLIEGVWITQEAGRYYLLYAGNDFSTARYGIGAAVANAPLGPYHKASEVFLSSTQAWWGPGHPSVALAPDGRRHIFLHAFRPGEAGYRAFRALLAAPVLFENGLVRLEPEPRDR